MKYLIYIATFSAILSLLPVYSFEIIPLKLELTQEKAVAKQYSGCTEDYAETEQCVRAFEKCVEKPSRKEILMCFEEV